jgi:hypothetical protein
VVSVLAAAAPTTVVGSNKGTTFNVGSASQDLGLLFNKPTLQASLRARDTLRVYDRAPGPYTYTVTHGELDRTTELRLPNGQVVRLTQYLPLDGVDTLEVNGTDGGNTFVVDDEFPTVTAGGVPVVLSLRPMQVVLNTGAGNDDVHVSSTTDELTVNGQGGEDNVTLGDGTTGGLASSVSVTNAAGVTSLLIDDSAGPQAQSVSMVGDTGTGLISGFTPIKRGLRGLTSISFAVRDVLEINILAGKGNNSFSFFDVPVFTTLATGTGTNMVQVIGTEDRLFVNSQGTQDQIVVGGTLTQPAR